MLPLMLSCWQVNRILDCLQEFSKGTFKFKYLVNLTVYQDMSSKVVGQQPLQQAHGAAADGRFRQLRAHQGLLRIRT
jgi:hypothetical protein